MSPTGFSCSTGWIAFPSTSRMSAPIVSPTPWWSPGSISSDVDGSRNSLAASKSSLESERSTRPSVMVVTFSAATYLGLPSADAATARPSKMSTFSSPVTSSTWPTSVPSEP